MGQILLGLLQDTTNATNAFISWALEQPDTWFVTMSQLIAWMRDPVPASKMAEWYTCRAVDLTPPGE